MNPLEHKLFNLERQLEEANSQAMNPTHKSNSYWSKKARKLTDKIFIVTQQILKK